MIIRHQHNKDNPYFMLNRAACDDGRLSIKALGLHTYLMSKPDGWKVNVRQLMRRFECGESMIRTCLKELRVLGYTEIKETRDKKGRIEDRELLVHETPTVKNLKLGEETDIVINDPVVSKEKDSETPLEDPMKRTPLQRKEVQTALDHSMSAKKIGLTPEQFRIMTDAVLDVCGLTILVENSDSPDANWRHNDAKDAAVFLAQLGYDAHDVVDLNREWVEENDWRGANPIPKPRDLKEFISKGKGSPGAKKEYAKAVARGGDLE